jgi:hypothetical protein
MCATGSADDAGDEVDAEVVEVEVDAEVVEVVVAEASVVVGRLSRRDRNMTTMTTRLMRKEGMEAINSQGQCRLRSIANAVRCKRTTALPIDSCVLPLFVSH